MHNTFSSGIIVGNLARDPELRKTKAGTPVSNFSLVVDPRSDNSSDRGHIIDFVCFGSLAENVADALRRGMRVIAAGVIQQERWVDKAGLPHQKVSIKAECVGPDLRYVTADIFDGTEDDEEKDE